MKRPTPALLAATVAAVGLALIASINPPAADAKPREVNCVAIDAAMARSIQKASNAYAAGNTQKGDDWMNTYAANSRNYERYCLG